MKLLLKQAEAVDAEEDAAHYGRDRTGDELLIVSCNESESRLKKIREAERLLWRKEHDGRRRPRVSNRKQAKPKEK